MKKLSVTLPEAEFEIGDALGDGEKLQIVKMPPAFKPEAFKGLLVG